MRKFNEREKEIIKQLCKIDVTDLRYFHSYLGKIFFENGGSQALFIDPKQEKAALLVKEGILNDLELKYKEINYFIERVCLLTNLMKDGYIKILEEPYYKSDNSKCFFIPDSYRDTIRNNAGTSSPNENIPLPNSILLPNSIYPLIIKTFFGLPYITEELKYLAQNNFISDEEKRHKETLETERKQFEESLRIEKDHFKKTQIISWVSIGIAIILGLIGIFKNQTSTVKIEETQYKQALQQVDELKDQLKTYESKIDSLNVQINNNALPQKSPL